MENNLFTKLQAIKVELLNSNIKKSGNNKFSKYEYYELSDFLPSITQLCSKYGVFTTVSFSNDLATLTAINCDNTTETYSITSPMRDVELSSCNAIQSLGGVETYQRRYLYMSMFDITEPDQFDGNNGNNGNSTNSRENYTRNSTAGRVNNTQANQNQAETVELLAQDGQPVLYKKQYNSEKKQTYWALVNREDANRSAKFISDAQMQSILRGNENE